MQLPLTNSTPIIHCLALHYWLLGFFSFILEQMLPEGRRVYSLIHGQSTKRISWRKAAVGAMDTHCGAFSEELVAGGWVAGGLMCSRLSRPMQQARVTSSAASTAQAGGRIAGSPQCFL